MKEEAEKEMEECKKTKEMNAFKADVVGSLQRKELLSVCHLDSSEAAYDII